jgi:ParB/RepB/Spo0J family partition protein
MEDLAAAIQVQGFITRLRVRPDPTEDGYFQLVFGERRLRAARLAGLMAVPCDIANHTDADLIEIGLSENLQRQDLDPLDEARAIQYFIDHHGYTVRSLAERLGKDKTFVELRTKLLGAPVDIQQLVVQKPAALTAARELTKLATPEERAPLIAGILEGRLSTAAVRTLVNERRRPPPAPSGGGPARAASTQHDGDDRADRGRGAAPQYGGSAAAPGGGLSEKVLERDIAAVRTVMARWQQAHPFPVDQGERILSVITEILDDLEAIAEHIRDGRRH